MDDETRRDSWADWWADIANLAEKMPRPRRLPRDADVEELFVRFVKLQEQGTEVPGMLAQIASQDSEFRSRYSRDVLRSALEAARGSVISYLQHPLPTHSFPRPQVRDSEMISVRDGRIVVSGGAVDGRHHLRALRDLLAPGRPFVFARCPVCERIFVRAGRSVRCSLRCTQKANDAKRIGTRDRQEKNREAAARYRQRQRTAAEVLEESERKGR